ncbi:regulatory protein TetR [Actinobacteria bacterium OK074]|nr:regulatory protein TetR [Actinobacteria bacterium OK074]
MTGRPVRQALHSRTTRATRARILEAARRELSRSPDRGLADIAEAAGVTRRTVYAHFAGRPALVDGLAVDPADAIRPAIDVTRTPSGDAASALARLILTVWPVGDRYRTPIALARQDLGPDRLGELLSPARDTTAAVLSRGQRQGAFHTSIPPGPLSTALEALLLALLDSVSSGIRADDGAATATLIAAGVDKHVAAATVHRPHGSGPTRPPR